MAPTAVWRLLSRFLAKLLATYERVQVELHGKYSVERVAHVHAYERAYSTTQCALVLVLTPLPCLAAIVAVDLVPLRAPSDGYAANGVFWARAFFVAFAISATILEQMRCFVMTLPLSTRVLYTVSTAIAAGSAAYAYLMASLIGFPIPFTIIVCVPCFVPLLGITWLALWGAQLRRCWALRRDVTAYIKLLVVQFSLTLVYPGFNFVFLRLSGLQQTALALVLPLLKLAAKNVMSAVLSPRLEDFKPEVVIFNIEVFHALFLSCCMQSSTSWTTTLALMVLDVIHAWSSLHDVDNQLRAIAPLKAALNGARVASRRKQTGEPALRPLTLIETAIYFVHHDAEVARDPAIRVRGVHTASKTTTATAATVYPTPLVGPSLEAREIFQAVQVQHEETTSGNPLSDLSAHHRVRSLRAETLSSQELVRLSSMLSRVPDDTRAVLHVLSTDERVAYVTTVLKALHTAEFLLLVEFVEVMIPVVYCVYLTAMFFLPNRVYYPQLAQMDTHSLLSTIGNVLAYAALELVSFVVFSLALRRKLQVSPVHQLAFVLHSQWRIVQSMLVLWVVFSVEISLAHFGYDYSFRFEWLQEA